MGKWSTCFPTFVGETFVIRFKVKVHNVLIEVILTRAITMLLLIVTLVTSGMGLEYRVSS